jgi:5'-methylthioadenosine phosphorylase
MVTEYDWWHASEEDVSVDMVIGHLQANAGLSKAIIAELIPSIPEMRGCACGTALQYAILTQADAAPAATIEKLKPIVGKYLS